MNTTKPYTITKHIGDAGSLRGCPYWKVTFHTGRMAGSTGNDTVRRDLVAWIKAMGY